MDSSSKNYREKILSSPQEIVLKQGITNIDIRSVGKNCGIASQTVYNYFPYIFSTQIVI